MRTKGELKNNLDQFFGTESYYKHLSGMLYTDGVQYLAKNAECYWLLDEIFFAKRKEPFQVWTLIVNEQKQATLTMKEDRDAPILVNKHIPWTTFPLDSIDLWLIDGTLILPSEY